MKNIPINTKLPLNRCWNMVSRIWTVEEAETAIKWLDANEIITVKEYDELIEAAIFLRQEACYEGRMR